MVALNSSLARWSKSCPCMMRICLRKVDLPLSPAPSKSILTNRFTYVLSFKIPLSISLDFRSCSASLLFRRQFGKQTERKDRDGRKSAIFGQLHRSAGSETARLSARGQAGLRCHNTGARAHNALAVVLGGFDLRKKAGRGGENV